MAGQCLRWMELVPFGLRSAPLIFSAVADALEWIVRCRGVDHIFHYIDNFILVGPPRSDVCQLGLHTLMQTSENLHVGVQMAPNKTEGPSTCLTVLGIEIDTVAMELRLPAVKLQQLTDLLTHWYMYVHTHRCSQLLHAMCLIHNQPHDLSQYEGLRSIHVSL